MMDWLGACQKSMLFWILLFLFTFTAFMTIIGEDTYEYKVSRAKAALALVEINSETHELTHPELQPCLKPIIMLTTTWCEHCPEVKQLLGLDPQHPVTVDHDFVITIKDCTDREDVPDWVTGYPFFLWETPKGIRYTPWTNLKNLKWQYEESFKVQPVPKYTVTPPNRYPAFRGYTPRWTWPGNLKVHLRSVHGISEAYSLTQDQAEALHDALHEGHSAAKIRSYYRARNLITVP